MLFAMAVTNKAGRLAVLLVRFQVSPAVRNKDPKEILSELKAGYLRRAKEEHPDLVRPAQRKLAEEQFVKLKADFEEATQLIESGWASGSLHTSQTAAAASGRAPGSSASARGASGGGSAAYTPRSDFGQTFKPASKKQEFDTVTRVKGHAVFWGGLLAFLYVLREFLVFSAGSTYAWTRPESWNPFWVRRFKDEWGNEVGKARKDDQDRVERRKSGLMNESEKAVKKVKEKKERDMDNFYVKRGISNTRKKSYPRGMEPPASSVASGAEDSSETMESSALASRHHPEIAGPHPNAAAPTAAPKPGGTSTKARRTESQPPCEMQLAAS